MKQPASESCKPEEDKISFPTSYLTAFDNHCIVSDNGKDNAEPNNNFISSSITHSHTNDETVDPAQNTAAEQKRCNVCGPIASAALFYTYDEPHALTNVCSKCTEVIQKESNVIRSRYQNRAFSPNL